MAVSFVLFMTLFIHFCILTEPYTHRDFFAILGRGPRAFQIGKINAANHYFGKFSK